MFLIVLLLMLNFGMLAFLFVSSHHPPFGEAYSPGQLIIHTLNFTNEQKDKFETMRFNHRSAMNKLDDKNRELARQYFLLLTASPIDTAKKDSLEKMIQLTETKKADITFNHFQEIKSMLNNEQQAKFDELIPRLIPILIPPSGKPPRP